jgi:hypothetical protein
VSALCKHSWQQKNRTQRQDVGGLSSGSERRRQDGRLVLGQLRQAFDLSYDEADNLGGSML